MDYADLVRRASGGEVIAFVGLTRRFQHAAFGSALALVGDFQQAEDLVQEAFHAAWSSLPRIADPAAFPGSFPVRDSLPTPRRTMLSAGPSWFVFPPNC